MEGLPRPEWPLDGTNIRLGFQLLIRVAQDLSHRPAKLPPRQRGSQVFHLLGKAGSILRPLGHHRHRGERAEIEDVAAQILGQPAQHPAIFLQIIQLDGADFYDARRHSFAILRQMKMQATCGCPGFEKTDIFVSRNETVRLQFDLAPFFDALDLIRVAARLSQLHGRSSLFRGLFGRNHQQRFAAFRLLIVFLSLICEQDGCEDISAIIQALHQRSPIFAWRHTGDCERGGGRPRSECRHRSRGKENCRGTSAGSPACNRQPAR